MPIERSVSISLVYMIAPYRTEPSLEVVEARRLNTPDDFNNEDEEFATND